VNSACPATAATAGPSSGGFAEPVFQGAPEVLGAGPGDVPVGSDQEWFVVGRTVEEQTLPDPAAIRRLRNAGPSILSRAMAGRTAPDDQDVSFHFGVRIMITGMRALIDDQSA
jgi:hypothetical protein